MAAILLGGYLDQPGVPRKAATQALASRHGSIKYAEKTSGFSVASDFGPFCSQRRDDRILELGFRASVTLVEGADGESGAEAAGWIRRYLRIR